MDKGRTAPASRSVLARVSVCRRHDPLGASEGRGLRVALNYEGATVIPLSDGRCYARLWGLIRRDIPEPDPG
jgi:hypothetical protein